MRVYELNFGSYIYIEVYLNSYDILYIILLNRYKFMLLILNLIIDPFSFQKFINNFLTRKSYFFLNNLFKDLLFYFCFKK